MRSFTQEIGGGNLLDRVQSNIKRSFDQAQKGEDEVYSCIGGDQESLGNYSWRVKHTLGREPKEFMIIDQGATGSIRAKMVNPTGTTVDIVFDSDPTSFKISLR